MLSFWKHSACAYHNLRICKRPRLRELGHGSCTCTEAERLYGLRLLAADGFDVACKRRPVLAPGAHGHGGTHGRDAQGSLNLE